MGRRRGIGVLRRRLVSFPDIALSTFARAYRLPDPQTLRAIIADVGTLNLRPVLKSEVGRAQLIGAQDQDGYLLLEFQIQTEQQRMLEGHQFSQWRWLDRLERVGSSVMPEPVVEFETVRTDVRDPVAVGPTIARPKRLQPNQMNLSDFAVFRTWPFNLEREPFQPNRVDQFTTDHPESEPHVDAKAPHTTGNRQASDGAIGPGARHAADH